MCELDQLEIRDCELSDVPGILEIFNWEILHSTSIFEYEEKALEEREAWFNFLKSRGYPLIVAIDTTTPEKRVAGYCCLGVFRDKPAFKSTTEVSLYIHQGYRRRGLGKRLMKEIIQRGKDLGFCNIIAGITAENTASLKLYEQLGFSFVGTFHRVGYKFDRWLDCTFMELMIN
ncbi:sortase-like acyltransferase [Basidiobolus meristosporus CBS 931.73]|uniref:Sortase-like acyltransferase n=1 Tax=Basidiobolus meristosporus CBS 931.73 TaxID=1314790 RepID=A0A1Y1Y2L6_9FUNG|nr:sortase-like acyltransferase [Basidiobolus meristosporus CBS 931.73]|eukprot:ORX92240.1 sortase-like acyltransferase [Basidiobolus meristosporus CBS 931.73]